MKRLLLISFFICSVCDVFAQNIQLKGKVQFEDGIVAEFSNVTLQTHDSAFIAGVSTDLKGNFLFSKLKAGDYRLIVSSIGYEDNVTELRGLSQSIDLGILTMKEKLEALDEVTITAANVMNKSDRKLVFPNQQQLAASTNGVNLLKMLQLPLLDVNLLNNTVSLTTREKLQIQINGVKVTEQELMAVQPQDIIRIEYIENPGLRYENAGAVLNYIIKRHESGGAVSSNFLQSPYKGMGNYNISSKFSYKKSEFGINYMGMIRHLDNVWREREERFLFEDGQELIKQEIPQPGTSRNDSHQLLLNYNIQFNENDYFNVTAGYSRRSFGEDYYSLLTNSWNPDQMIRMTDFSNNESDRPWLDGYWSHSFKNKQSLILNVVGTYIKSNNDRIYQELTEGQKNTDLLSLIKGDKYSLIGEAIYEKAWKTGRLSGGVKHTQASVDNKYSGTVAYSNKMIEANTYVYLQYAGKIKKIDYMLGVGVYRSWLKQEGVEEYEAYTFRPAITLSYVPMNKFYIRLKGSIENYSPSLADISFVDQYIDSMQIQRGNPNLKPYDYYKFSLNSEFQFGKSSLSLWGMYMNYPDAIMEETFWEGDNLIRTNRNQKHLHQLMGSLTFKVRLFRDIINLSLTGGGNHFVSEGYTYTHKYTNWYYQASLFANYKQWTFMYGQYSTFNTFWGEQMNGGENGQEILLNYKYKDWVFGAGMSNPFSTTKSEIRNYNQYASFRKISSMEDASRLFFIQFSWNFNFGRKHNSSQKNLNNADTDAGIMKVGR